jgi:hypothetical protein
VAVLDQLASELSTTVRRASAAREEAGLVAQFDGMRADVEAAIQPIRDGLSVLEAPELQVSDDAMAQVRSRREWVQAQLAKVRTALEKDPTSIRRGELWRETKKAIEALRGDLRNVQADAYNAMLTQYAERDGELLDSLPPGTTGLVEYRSALGAYERAVERLPTTPTEVAAADAAGRRLREIRERVEAAAVPADLRDQWRALRGSGLPLRELTPEFKEWLSGQGLDASALVVYRSG